jgi:L-arabinose isomerase
MSAHDKPRIGLLPLMLELYKQYKPEILEKQRPFIAGISDSLSEFVNVVTADVCTRSSEVRTAIRTFEAEDVDLVVIVFTSYATSLSALNPLLETNLPLLLFSTTPKNSMAEGITVEDISLNHGVHGYMDLANVLRRFGRRFFFVAGTKEDKKVLSEIEQWATAAKADKLLRRSTIGIAGYTFDGMGDFGVDTTTLNAVFGPEVKHVPLDLLAGNIAEVSEKDVERETAHDHREYIIADDLDPYTHKESNRVYLGLRKTIDELSLTGLTMHFQGVLENPGIITPPFLAISKLQAQGIAYAGEGDILGTVANMMLRFMCGNTMFTEPFCPDFEGGRLLMGHMGESNPAFGEQTVLRKKKFLFGDAIAPTVTDVTLKKKITTMLNLGIVENCNFQLIGFTGEICRRIQGAAEIDMPYFHFKPATGLTHFLTEYGLAGGTHHLAMTTGDRTGLITKLSEVLNVNNIILG